MMKTPRTRFRPAGWTMIEALVAITISASVFVLVGQIIVRIQSTYRQMEQESQLARDGWNLEWDLRHDAARLSSPCTLVIDSQQPSRPPSAIEWIVGNREHIVRYRHDAEHQSLVREEESQGQLTRRDRYRIPNRASVEWSIYPQMRSRWLALRTVGPRDMPSKQLFRPIHLIVALRPSTIDQGAEP